MGKVAPSEVSVHEKPRTLQEMYACTLLWAGRHVNIPPEVWRQVCNLPYKWGQVCNLPYLGRLQACPHMGYSFSSSVIDAELMQYRRPVGGGPSLKTCPRWAPQRRQVTSVRTIPNDRSWCSAIAWPFTSPFLASIGA